MDFSTNSFVRSCSLDCELKPVDVVSDKNRFGSNFRIPRNSFTCHWIRIASIVLCLDLQSLPTHVSEAEMSCGVFWSLAQIWKSKICLCFWEFYMQMFSLWPEVVLGQFGCIFWGVLQTFSDSVMTSLIKIFLMDQFIK